MDNRYFKNGCPPLMQDAKFITNYTRSRIVDQFVRNVNKIESAQDYKHFLQKNGDTIMNRERAHIENMNTCKVQGKCVPLSGLPGSSALFPNKSCGNACKR